MPSLPYRITLSGFSSSELPNPTTAYVPDYMVRPFNIGVAVTVATSGGGMPITYNVEHTYDNTGPTTSLAASTAPGAQNYGALSFISSALNWFPNAGITAQTSNGNGNYAYPVTGIRLNITAGTSNCSATMTLVQAG